MPDGLYNILFGSQNIKLMLISK